MEINSVVVTKNYTVITNSSQYLTKCKSISVQHILVMVVAVQLLMMGGVYTMASHGRKLIGQCPQWLEEIIKLQVANLLSLLLRSSVSRHCRRLLTEVCAESALPASDL